MKIIEYLEKYLLLEKKNVFLTLSSYLAPNRSATLKIA